MLLLCTQAILVLPPEMGKIGELLFIKLGELVAVVTVQKIRNTSSARHSHKRAGVL